MTDFYTDVFSRGDYIYVSGYDDNGIKYHKKETYNPTLFIESQEKTKYKGIYGENLSPIKSGSIKETRDFIKKYEDVEGFKIHGQQTYKYAYIADNFKTISHDRSLIRVFNFDIETACGKNGYSPPEIAGESITSIACTTDSINFHVYSTKHYNSIKSELLKDHPNIKIKYHLCYSEKEMLSTFIGDFTEYFKPDVITGWNVNCFDIPYLINRVKLLFGNSKLINTLSPWNIIKANTKKSKYGEDQIYEIMGIAILDLMESYKQFTYKNQESYSLNNISFVELGECKLSYEEFGNLRNLYEKDFQKFIDYNIKDVILVGEIDEKMGLLDLIFDLAYSSGINYIDTFYQVRMWDAILYNELYKKNIVIPPKKFNNTKGEKYEGAYVKPPIVGRHDWVVSFDINSLYPNIIRQYNISPEKLIECDLVSDVHKNIDRMLGLESDLFIGDNESYCANGQKFDRTSEGFIPKIIKRLYVERKELKDLMIENQKLFESTSDKKYKKLANKYNVAQKARKIALNSYYGAMGNQYFRYYDLRMAEAVTTTGQFIIRRIENNFNNYLNGLLSMGDNPKDFVVAVDTDSNLLRLGDLIDKFPQLDSVEKKINFLDKFADKNVKQELIVWFDEIAQYTNAIENCMVMGREAIAEKGIWTAKKRYILKVWDNEGVRYSKPNYKVMGIESIKSSTPHLIREKLNESYRIMMDKNEDDMIDFIENFRTEFKNENIENISFPRGITNVEKYSDVNIIFKKGTPIHARGSLIYNKLLKDHGLENQYEEIKGGDKIKFIYLKLPNPTFGDVISFADRLPTELNLHKYIDYNLQFEKTFLKPLKLILDKIGWKTEKTTYSMDQFC